MTKIESEILKVTAELARLKGAEVIVNEIFNSARSQALTSCADIIKKEIHRRMDEEKEKFWKEIDAA